MRKFMKVALMAMVGLFVLVPMINVNAAEGIAEVKTEQEFLDALANESIHTITLTDNIETQKKINIKRPVTIDGNGKTIKYVGTFKGEVYDNTVWGSGKDGDGYGVYVIQVYRTEATIKNITLTGGNA